MCESWRLHFEHFVKNYVLWCGWQPLFSSDHMSNSHQIVINHIREMISWVSITLHYDLVIYTIIIKNYFTVNQIFKFCFTLRDQHPNYVRFSTLYAFINFILRYTVTESIIFSFLMLQTSLLSSHLLEPIGCAEAMVCMPILQECVNKLFVNTQSL